MALLPSIWGETLITITDSLEDAIAKSLQGANDERKTEASKRLNYYYGDQLGNLKDLLNQQYDIATKLKLQLVFRNIVKTIIDKISLVYKSSPARMIMGPNGEVSDKDQEIWDNIEQKTDLNVVLKTVNRFTTLLQRTVLKVGWRNDFIKFDIITPNIMDIVVSDEDPLEPVAVFWNADSAHKIKILREQQATEDEAQPRTYVSSKYEQAMSMVFGSKESKYEFWSNDMDTQFPGQNFIFTGNGKIIPIEGNPGNKNPILINGKPIIPVVPFGSDYPVDDWFLDGGHDLINYQDTINVLMTNLQYFYKMQSFSYPVFKGVASDTKMFVDPSEAIVLPAGRVGETEPDFKFVSPDAKLQELYNVITNKVKEIENDYNISLENFNDTGSPSSGIALKIKNMALTDYRQDQIELYRTAERKLFNIVRAVWNTFSPSDKFSDDVEMVTDFAEVKFPEDPATELDNLQKGIALGVDSNVNYLMRKNPDLTEEEAAKQVLTNIQSKNKAANRFTTSLTVPDKETGTA